MSLLYNVPFLPSPLPFGKDLFITQVQLKAVCNVWLAAHMMYSLGFFIF